ncbi:hypothetical protein NC653_005741 [Populus alba x Populus x berolinensis]|uniref:Uncharacterized protein n=1 Tax=Populus alba x Populus x berolinensis TaxID=444605 RepID=A0AAD6RDW7_9ROSI|nr:hypothetical protein NC653_005741 [Populus alba x Populus x berolinensis]
MKSDNLLTENLISYVIFVLLFATSGRSPQLQVTGRACSCYARISGN